MKNTISLFVFLFGILSLTYSQTVTIGTQVWMTKNLDVSTFRNGDPIPQAKTDEEWETAKNNNQPAWCYYENKSENGAKFGKLYNWFAVNDVRGLAPVGFHVPSNSEWKTLSAFLGDEFTIGEKMKSTSGWKSYSEERTKTCPNCASWNLEYRKKVPCNTCKDSRKVTAQKTTHSGNGKNSSGFSGLPGGFRVDYGKFYSIGKDGFWWCSDENSSGRAYFTRLYNDINNIHFDYNDVSYGFSVRCIKD